MVKELKEQGQVSIKTYENASVMFIDIVGFSKIAERINPKFLVNKLNNLFSQFDKIIENYDDSSFQVDVVLSNSKIS